MLKIGEFSKINRLTVKTLRLYDRLGLIKPKHVDISTGYRFYDTDQLPLLHKIIGLKQTGFSLAEISLILNTEISNEEFMNRLENKSKELEMSVREEENRLTRLKAYINTLRKDKNMNEPITIKDLPEVTVASIRRIVPSYDEFFTFWPAMGKIMQKQGLECTEPAYCFAIYHDGEYKEKNIDVEICEAVKKAGNDEGEMKFTVMPAVPQAACIIHKGPYTTIGKSYATITQWIEDNGYKITGHMRESYHDGIWNQEDPNNWITEIQVPIEKIK